MSEPIPGRSEISNRTPIRLSLGLFVSLLATVAAAAWGFQTTITSSVKAQMNPYLTRDEWLTRILADDRRRDAEYFWLKSHILKLEAHLK